MAQWVPNPVTGELERQERQMTDKQEIIEVNQDESIFYT